MTQQTERDAPRFDDALEEAISAYHKASYDYGYFREMLPPDEAHPRGYWSENPGREWRYCSFREHFAAEEGLREAIADALRPSVVQPTDRERLARALYILSGAEANESSREQLYDATDAEGNVTRAAALWMADRLTRILGGSPAVQGEPMRWLVTHTDGTESSRRTAPDEIEQAAYAKRGWTVTPLYVGAPAAQTISAGRPSREQLASVLRRMAGPFGFGCGSPEDSPACGLCAWCEANALLSRIPTEVNDAEP